MKSILNRLILLPFVLLIWTLPGCETSDVKESTSDAVGWARSELKVALQEKVKPINDAIEATGQELKLFCKMSHIPKMLPEEGTLPSLYS